MQILNPSLHSRKNMLMKHSNLGLMTGSEGKFNRKSDATRSQAAKVVSVVMDWVSPFSIGIFYLA
ncbi:hypothetical protein [Cytobacillus oceanisediminis]|uniref:hypothetical protein n=1 Tax=Cytobacillus oceanisediminis TaxID=665099 RepID=UPI0037368F58